MSDKIIDLKIEGINEDREIPNHYRFFMPQNEKMLFLYGHNGSGKTTLTSLMGENIKNIKYKSKTVTLNNSPVVIHSNLNEKITHTVMLQKPKTRCSNNFKESFASFLKDVFLFNATDRTYIHFWRFEEKIKSQDWGDLEDTLRFYSSRKKELNLLEFYDPNLSFDLNEDQYLSISHFILFNEVWAKNDQEKEGPDKEKEIENLLKKVQIEYLNQMSQQHEKTDYDFWIKTMKTILFSKRIETVYSKLIKKVSWLSNSSLPQNIQDVKKFISANHKNSPNKMDFSIERICKESFPGKKYPKTFVDYELNKDGLLISFHIYEGQISNFSEGEKVIFRVNLICEMSSEDINESIIIFDDVLDVTDRSSIHIVATKIRTFFKNNKKENFVFLMTFHDYKKMEQFSKLLANTNNQSKKEYGIPGISVIKKQIFDHAIFKASYEGKKLDNFLRGSDLVKNSQLLLYRPIFDSLNNTQQDTLRKHLKSNEFMHFNPSLKKQTNEIEKAFQELFYTISHNSNADSLNYKKIDVPKDVNNDTLKKMANEVLRLKENKKNWCITLRTKMRNKENWINPINVFVFAWAIRFTIEEWIFKNKSTSVSLKQLIKLNTTRNKFEKLPQNLKNKNKDLILPWIELLNNELHHSGIGILDNTTSGLLIFRKLKHNNFQIKILK